MVKHALVEEKIKIPANVDVDVAESTVTVKGPKGIVDRDFSHAQVSIIKENNSIITSNYFPRKKERALVGTIAIFFVKSLILSYLSMPLKPSSKKFPLICKIFSSKKSLTCGF